MDKKKTMETTNEEVDLKSIHLSDEEKAKAKCLHRRAIQNESECYACPDCGSVQKPGLCQLSINSIDTEKRYKDTLDDISNLINLAKFIKSDADLDEVKSAIRISNEENIHAAEACTFLKKYISKIIKMRIANGEVPIPKPVDFSGSDKIQTPLDNMKRDLTTQPDIPTPPPYPTTPYFRWDGTTSMLGAPDTPYPNIPQPQMRPMNQKQKPNKKRR